MKAFPSKEYVPTSDKEVIAEVHYGGMDLRDYFAAKALIAIGCFEDDAKGISKLAKDSYKIADAMMKAREQ